MELEELRNYIGKSTFVNLLLDSRLHVDISRNPAVDLYPKSARSLLFVERIDGQSLQQTVVDKGGALHQAQVLNCACEILDALDYLHTNAYAHDKIRPDNVFIRLRQYAYPADFQYLLEDLPEDDSPLQEKGRDALAASSTEIWKSILAHREKIRNALSAPFEKLSPRREGTRKALSARREETRRAVCTYSGKTRARRPAKRRKSHIAYRTIDYPLLEYQFVPPRPPRRAGPARPEALQTDKERRMVCLSC